jgi:trigger factor
MHTNEADGGMVCSITVNVIPEFVIPDYRSIRVGAVEITITEKDVDDWINVLLRQRAKYEVVQRPAKKGDFVRLNYAGKFEDGSMVANVKTIPEIYGAQKNSWKEVGGNRDNTIRAMADALVGVEAGDRKTIAQTFPSNFIVPELAGKAVAYDLEIIEVLERIIPEINGETLKMLDVDTVDGLRDRVRRILEHRRMQEGRENQRDELTSKLCELTDVKIPSDAAEDEAVKLAEKYIANMVKIGEPLQILERRSPEIIESFKPAAYRRLKVDAILDGIAKLENIEIEMANVEEIIQQDVRTGELDMNRYVAELKRDRALLGDVRRRAIRLKTMGHLMRITCEDLRTAEIPAERENLSPDQEHGGQVDGDVGGPVEP